MVRHARVQLALKGAFAAAAAWFVAARLLPDDVATYAYYAPLGAVIAIHPTVHRSMTEAGRNVAGIVLGAVIALLTEAVLGVSVLTVALVVAVGILAAGMRWLGSQGAWVPTAALLTLVVGSSDQQDYVLAYAGLTLMGAVLAVGVNLILPALPLQRSARSLTDLRDTLARELDALADYYCPPADSTSRTERSSQGHLDHLLGEMRSAVRESGEAADANRRARNKRETLRGLHRQAQALEQLGFLVQDLGLLLDDHDCGGGSLGSAPQVRLPAAQALRALANAVRAVTAGRSDVDLTATATDAVDHLATTLRAHPPDAVSHPDLLVTGTVVTALRRSLTVIHRGDEDDQFRA
ncbi:FUSC family protein [Pengzhenrongella frigida]|uniref:FUSC family protein n=1 Tax=Pengzhenrongella frigida TaxID=1259133 RepID=UPI0013EE3ED6|nr:aromatic acid exporter family protein [Cellulomonas sp. HLT2-17]